MDFKTQIKSLGERVQTLKAQVLTEEATKNAFIMPFIKELGYDVFNPFEVTPELVADVGIKQGEKIDYAILKDGEPIVLIECKHHAGALNVHNESQLFRYFHTTTAKFAILTNGIEYRFYTDLVEPNKMDDKPFFSFDVTEIKDNQVEELKKFHKAHFDSNSIVNTASELKFTGELKKLINEEINNPSSDFVKYFARQVYPGMVTQKVLDQFTNLTKKSFAQQINDIVTDRLKSALNESQIQDKIIEEEYIEAKVEDSKVVTTVEELEGFYIVKAILCSKVRGNRIHYRDAQSYFAILFDDNNRKTICRLYFTDRKKMIGIFDEDKKETKFELQSSEDIYTYTDKLLSIVEYYDK